MLEENKKKEEKEKSQNDLIYEQTQNEEVGDELLVSQTDKDQKNQIESEILVLKQKIEELEKEKNEFLDNLKRARADLINYKKNEAERFEEFSKFSLSVLIKELIEVLDSFDLGIAMTKEEDSGYKGLVLIRTKLYDILKKFGLEEIKVVKGEVFNPNYHEAVLEVDDKDLPAGSIFDVLEKGYLLNSRVIRPAKVKVVKDKTN